MNEVNIIDKIAIEKNLVLIGKNGVGKTHQLIKIDESSDVKTIFLSFDLSDGFDGLVKKLMSDNFVSSNKKVYDQAVEALDLTSDELSKVLSSFDMVQTSNRYDDIESRHRILKPHIGLIENNFSVKFDHNNGKGIDYFLRIQLILKMLEDKKDTVLLIDEPEKYCFPGLIIRLAKLLANHPLKVVCASHSPIFVNNFIDDFSELVFLKDKYSRSSYTSEQLLGFCYNTYEVSLKKQYFKSKNTLLSSKERFKNFFSNLLKYNIIESLFADVAIITEGSTDKQLMEYILRMNPYYYNMSLFQANGKDMFPIYLTIFNKYSLATFSLFDLDENKDDKHILYNTYIKNRSTSYYGFEKNIEKSFDLGNEAEKEKQHVGPTLLLVKVLNNDDEAVKNIGLIKEQLEVAYLSSIVGKDNIQTEIGKISKELIDRIPKLDGDYGLVINKYLMLNKMVKKVKSNYDKRFISRLEPECELNVSYYYLKEILLLTNMSKTNFDSEMKSRQSKKLYRNDNIELLFYIYAYEEKNKELDLELISDITFNTSKLKYLSDFYILNNREMSFEEYLIQCFDLKLAKLEEKYLNSSDVIRKMNISDKMDVKKVTTELKNSLSELKFNDRKKTKDLFLKEYREIISEIT